MHDRCMKNMRISEISETGLDIEQTVEQIVDGITNLH